MFRLSRNRQKYVNTYVQCWLINPKTCNLTYLNIRNRVPVKRGEFLLPYLIDDIKVNTILICSLKGGGVSFGPFFTFFPFMPIPLNAFSAIAERRETLKACRSEFRLAVCSVAEHIHARTLAIVSQNRPADARLSELTRKHPDSPAGARSEGRA